MKYKVQGEIEISDNLTKINKDNTKQYSIYLSKGVQKVLKTKAIRDDKTISEVINNLIINNYFDEQNIKEADKINNQ